MEIQMIELQMYGDERGCLVVAEQLKDIPFEIKRVYYMYGTTLGFHRGRHSHRKLEQVLICVHGSCKILLDNGDEKQVLELNNPDTGLYIGSGMWREMFDFNNDAVLMCLASECYDESDYIRDYEQFLEWVKGDNR